MSAGGVSGEAAGEARAHRGAEPWLDPAARPYVVLEGVTKRFGDFVAVDDVSLEVFRGEIFCLLGGSGSGKTTLLRMLAGFEAPAAGRLVIDGQDMAAVPPHQRPVNMMFQSYALFPHMSVEKNVSFGLEQERLPRREIAGRVGEMLELVQLTGLGHRRPHQLSGGQRQRVALARALVKRPKVLLLDEPLAALDRKLRERTQFELINIQERLGVTFIVVTHDQEEAMTLASRIGVMKDGAIVQVGTPSEIYEQPRSVFVADFIGSVNLFEGQLIEQGPEHVRIRSEDLGVVLCLNRQVGAAPGARVWAALRPERIKMGRERPAASENVQSAVVREIAYLGDLSVYRVQLDSGTMVRVTQPNAAGRAAGPIARNDGVWLTWDPSDPVVLAG